jgi:alpha-1,3-mannosyl-glycoprotein beta-1,2-N-acetylglucosaminyltransferase
MPRNVTRGELSRRHHSQSNNTHCLALHFFSKSRDRDRENESVCDWRYASRIKTLLASALLYRALSFISIIPVSFQEAICVFLFNFFFLPSDTRTQLQKAMMRVMTHMPTRTKKRKKPLSSSTGSNIGGSSSGSTMILSNCSNLRLEKMAIAALFMIAWGWIMVTMGMVFYHGYYNHHNSSSSSHIGYHQQRRDDQHSFPGQQEAAAAMDRLHHLKRLAAEGGGGGEGQNSQAQPVGKQAASSIRIQPYESPLLIFTCHREEYLNATLADIFAYIPRDCRMGCPIIISQDGNYAPVAQVIRYYQAKFQTELNIPVLHWQHSSSLRGANAAGAAAYQALAVHYGWALQKIFDNNTVTAADGQAAGSIIITANVPPMPPAKRVLILEEDLHVAVDFFDYFTALAPLLDRDATLLAISAYNDNGYHHAISLDAASTARVLRSDFFPGLGWMMTRHLWTNELSTKWPTAYWDDWLREPAQRQGRHVLRPEVSRTFHFGVSGGASNNQFGNQLSKVVLNPTAVTWSTQDLSYLNLDRFDRAYWQMLHSSRRVTSLAEAKQLILQQQQQAAGATTSNRRPELVLRLEYNNLQEFAKFASSLGLSTDEKAGVPRTAYKGVVETRFGSSSNSNNKSNSSNNLNHILLLTTPMQELQKEFEDVI